MQFKTKSGTRGDGLEVMSMYFGFQHPCKTAHKCLQFQLEGIHSLSLQCSLSLPDTHTHTTHILKDKNKS